MKRKICLCALGLAAILIGLTGCKKVEQTEFKIENCQYSTTIQGTLNYPAGHTAEKDFSAIVPAANKTIFIDVDYSYYRDENESFKRFTTYTNGEGKFSITIPIRAKSGYANVNVASFPDKHYIVEYNPITDKLDHNLKNVIYSFYGTFTSLDPGKIKNHNILLQYEIID